jgi:hypothetical protein
MVVAVSVFVSTPPIVLVACLVGLVISSSTIALLALIFPSRKLKDNDGASVATGGGGKGEDSMNELP